MKFADKQRKRQTASRRAMGREKKEIKLMHERTLLNNFGHNQEYTNMYDRMLTEDFSRDSLSSTEKKIYMTCRKYIMYNDYQNLCDIQREMNSVRDMMDVETNEEYYEILRRKYNKLKKEHNDFRKELTETEEERKLFNLCKGIDSLSNYE